MSRAIHIWLVLLFSISGYASGPTLERDDLVVSVRAPKTVVPGQYETFILEVSNDYDFPLNFEVFVNKPSSWRLLSGVENVPLQPKEKRMVIFVLELDRACEIGDQKINFEFYDKQNDIRILETVTTTVKDVHKIKVIPARQPQILTGGESFEVAFEIRNLGNCYENVIVNADPGTLEETTISLPPNASRFVNVSHRVNNNLSHVGYASCGVSVAVEYSDEPIRSMVSIKAFPKSTQKSDPYQRLPVQASINYFGAKNLRDYEDGFQLELKGAGMLDRNNRHRIDFVARGPNRFSIARFGNFDQYSLQYKWQQSRTSYTTVKVGDFAYNLTPVTEMFRWARGVGVEHVTKKFDVGGFYNQPRFFTDVKYQYAAYGKLKWTPKFSTQLSAMQKYFAEGASPATLLSLKGQLDLTNHMASAEISTGSRGGASGIGANIDLQGRFKNLRYQSQNIYAGKDFPGYYNNSLFSNSTVNYRMTNWDLNAGVFYNSTNPAQDTVFTTAPYSISNTIGATRFFNKQSQLQLSYIYRFREDRLPGKKFSFREHATRYLFSHKVETWSTQIDGELARTENLLVNLEDNTGNTYNIRFRGNKNMNEKVRMGGFVQYLYTNRYDRDSRSYVLYGANVSYLPVRNLRLAAGYRNNYLLDEYYSDRVLLNFDASADYGSHSVSVNTSHALVRNTVGRTDFFVNARYTYRINAPIRKVKDLYSLSGQLRSSNARNVAGVVITINGQSVISDEYGRFVVNDLPEGLHYLYIDPGTLGIGLVTLVETPVEVMISAEGNNKVVIPVVRGGSISGNIAQCGASSGKKVPLKVVKITNGEKEFLTYSDDEGNYSFKNLIPGNWKVRVIHDNSGKYQIANNNIAANVTEGRATTVDFELKQRTRKIKFSEQSVDLKIGN